MIYDGILGYARYRYLWVALGATMISIALYVSQYTNGTPRGSTWQGYMLGTLAALLVLWLAWLGVRRRRYGSRSSGSVLGWTSAHVYFGIAVVLIASLHSAGHLSMTVHGITFWLLVGVVLSGIFGMYGYLRLPSTAADNRKGQSRSELFAELLTLDRRARELAAGCEPDTALAVVSSIERTVVGGGFLVQLRGADRSLYANSLRSDRAGSPELAPNPDQRAVMALVSSRIPRGRKRSEVAALQELLPILSRRQAVLARIRRDVQLQALLSVWLFVHVPLTIGLLGALAVHVATVFLYW
jgi:hypothetical protein